jgi:hypothetical protein
MKLNSKRGNTLSLKKNTIAHLNNAQTTLIRGGAVQVTGKQGIPETCGYACGDCMSTLNTLIGCFPAQTVQR